MPFGGTIAIYPGDLHAVLDRAGLKLKHAERRAIRRVVRVPVSAIREPRAWGTGDVLVRSASRQERTFTYREHRVWGLTERVLRQLVQLLG